MEKRFFFIKLLQPRPTFSQDRTEAETKIIQQHVAYWMDLTERGISVIFGPVFDPKGPYGVGIIEVQDEAAANAIMAEDPTTKSGGGFAFEIHPMQVGMVRK